MKFRLPLPVALLMLLIVVGIFASMLPHNQEQKYLQNPVTNIHIGSATVHAEVASTSGARERGLSGHPPLAEGEGMLFVFDWDDLWGFWMKDMQFAIDIIWIDASGRVVTIAKQVEPASYPKVFYPARAARFVLEVPAGFTNRHGIAEGTKVVVE